MQLQAPEEVRLNELDKVECWDYTRRHAPSLTWEEFEAAWERFQADKAERRTQRGRQ
jgi:hypothetical protein